MDSISEGNEGYYQSRDLPVRLAERAARVTDDADQLSIAAFRSPEAHDLCVSCRKDLNRERKRMINFVVTRGNEAEARRGVAQNVNHVIPLQ